MEALLHKTKPLDIASAIPFIIQDADADGSLRMGDKHPVLALLQHYIDPADPLNFAPLLAVRPEEGQGPKSAFETFGFDDSYAPPATLARYVYAAERMALAPPPEGVVAAPPNELSLVPASAPVSGNVTVDGETETLVCRQYEPQTDGHFVADEVSEANDDVMSFLSALLSGNQPQVPAMK